MIPSRGFSLPTLLLLLTLGSLIMLACLAAVSQVMNQAQQRYQRYYLTTTLQQLLDKIAQDLKRAGFVYAASGQATSPATLPLPTPLVVGHYPGEPANSCLLLYYDRNRSGFLRRLPSSALADTIGYRLHQGNIETQQGITQCHSSRWEDRLDERVIRLQQFQVRYSPGGSQVQLTLQARLTRYPQITQRLQAVIHLENLP